MQTQEISSKMKLSRHFSYSTLNHQGALRFIRANNQALPRGLQDTVSNRTHSSNNRLILQLTQANIWHNKHLRQMLRFLTWQAITNPQVELCQLRVAEEVSSFQTMSSGTSLI